MAAETPNAIREFWIANHTTSDPLNLDDPDRIHTTCPWLECEDGFKMSVQASGYHYATPRTYLDDGWYAAWEIGYPSEREPLILDFIDGGEDTDPTDTVYGYIPTDTINEVIAKHGGIKGVVTPGELKRRREASA